MTSPSDLWSAVSAARIPAGELKALAPLRTRADVRVIVRDEVIWIRWSERSDEVVRCLLPVPGVTLWTKRADGHWRRFRSRLPSSKGPPDEPGLPLIQVLQPERFEPFHPTATPFVPLRIRLVRSSQPLKATALSCEWKTLRQWSDTATTLQLSQLRAARSHNRVVVMGSHVPSLVGAIRFTGMRLFVPLGFRIEPVLSESLILETLGANGDELAFATDSAIDVIPTSAFAPLSRAGIRLAGGES